jgi:hypothetical protein
MATPNNPFVPAEAVDGLQQIAVTGTRTDDYSLVKFLNQNLIKSAKFAVRFLKLPAFVSSTFKDPRSLTYLCDSVEFPGQALTASDYRIPGKLKVKLPFLREISEINLSFYINNKTPVYTMFNNWIENISYNTAQNRYFDEIVGQFEIIQFEDTSSEFVASANPRKNMIVKLIDAYPLNVQSMPSNWGDDGYHKVNVAFYFRDLLISGT